MLATGITGLELLRRQHRLSQKEVASAIGVPQSYISYIERGLQPAAEQLRALGSLFGVEESAEHVLLERFPLPAPEVPAPPDMKERILAMRAAREEKKQ